MLAKGGLIESEGVQSEELKGGKKGGNVVVFLTTTNCIKGPLDSGNRNIVSWNLTSLDT